MGLSTYEQGILSSSMLPGSAAMMLGRSQAWVVRMRLALATPAEPVGEPDPIPQPASSAIEATLPAKRPPLSRAPAAPLPAAKPVARRHRKPQPVRLVRLKPVSAQALRFARWFDAAGWCADEIAWLFDVGPEEMAEALEAAR